MKLPNRLRVAFLVPGFPAVSETFIINQAADLIDRGIEVDIYSFSQEKVGPLISERYFQYQLGDRTIYIQPPGPRLRRLVGAGARFIRLFRLNWRAALNAVNIFSYGRLSLSFQLLYWSEALAGKNYSLVHCHFGHTGLRYMAIRDALKIKTPFVTTFYGRDASVDIALYSPVSREALLRESRFIFVMSKDMKRRLEKLGAPPEKVRVLPVSIDVSSYPFCARVLKEGSAVELVSVGRLVEKKGTADLIAAVKQLRERTSIPFKCTIIGGGPLEISLKEQVRQAGLEAIVSFRGSMQIESIVNLLLGAHILVQSSKTASDGEME